MAQERHLDGLECDPGGPAMDRTLVLILHGWMSSPTRLADVVAATREAFAGTAGLDLYVPRLPYSRWYSFQSPTDITARVLVNLDQLCADVQRYSRIYFVGHSVGAVIARRVFLAATGIDKAVPSEGALRGQTARAWVAQVQRIVTLGGLNRGWIRSGRLGVLETLMSLAVAMVGHGWPGTSSPTLFHVRRGAPFIVQTRLQWLALQRADALPKPLVVQLLGTRDNLVAPDDAVDFAVDGEEKNYLYIELPNTQHKDATSFSDDAGAKRKELFKAALTEELPSLLSRSIRREFLTDTLPPPPDTKVSRVTFVIHGIRDDGYWTRRIAQRIHEAAANRKQSTEGSTEEAIDEYRAITSSYGYFAMLPFIWPWIRRQKVEWLMDQYVSAVSSYPCADFSYVGHSNGTYLIARALQDYPAIRFRNIFFAGSVVRRDYPWKELFTAKRVERLVNMVATADWVVAIFPSALEPARPFDLGGAGFGGFKDVGTVPDLHEIHYVVGKHSAALVETQWTRIAEFIVNDTVPAPPDHDYSPHQSSFLQALGKGSSALLALIVLIFGLGIPYLLLRAVPSLPGVEAAEHVMATIAYLLLLWLVITKV